MKDIVDTAVAAGSFKTLAAAVTCSGAHRDTEECRALHRVCTE